MVVPTLPVIGVAPPFVLFQTIAIVMSEFPHIHTPLLQCTPQDSMHFLYSADTLLITASVIFTSLVSSWLALPPSWLPIVQRAVWEADRQTVSIRPDICASSDVVGPIVAICMCILSSERVSRHTPHTHTHKHTHKYIHTHTQTHTHVHMYINACAFMHTNTCTYCIQLMLPQLLMQSCGVCGMCYDVVESGQL